MKLQEESLKKQEENYKLYNDCGTLIYENYSIIENFLNTVKTLKNLENLKDPNLNFSKKIKVECVNKEKE